MKKILIIFTILLSVVYMQNPVDLLTSVQTGICSLSSISGIPNTYLLKFSGNNYFIPFQLPFTSTPLVGFALSQFSTATSSRYQIQVTQSITNITGFTLTFGIEQNLWNSLAYSWIASTSNSILVGSFVPSNYNPQSNTSTATTFVQIFQEILVNPNQAQVKFDLFISGFNLRPLANDSSFLLSASIKYNANDQTNSQYSIYNDYIYSLTNGYLINPQGSIYSQATSTIIQTNSNSNVGTSSGSDILSINTYNSTISGPSGTIIISQTNSTTGTTPSGIPVINVTAAANVTTNSTIPSEMAISLTFLGTLNFLELTYISHPVSTSSAAIIQLTTGYNSFVLTSTSNSNSYNLFDSVNNKNNLGSIYAAAFYGFNGISLTPINTIDATISLHYSYSTSLSSSGSTINLLATSYYFYEPLATSIVDNLLDSLISGISWTWSPAILNSIPTPSSNSYYVLTFTGTVGTYTATSTSFTVVPNSNYVLIIELLDQQGCWTGSGFIPTNIQITPTGSSTSVGSLTSNVSPSVFFVNPTAGCTSSSPTQFSTPVEQFYRTYVYTFTTTGTSASFSVALTQSGLVAPATNNIYVKKFRIYRISSNDILNSILTEATYSSINYFYNFQTTGSSSYNFYSAYSIGTPSNAIQLSIKNNFPISFSPATSFFLSIGKTYTVSFYILDSAGNINTAFSTPTINVNLNGNSVFSQTATLTNPFCSSLFTSTSILTTPTNDNLYISLSFAITATQITNTFTFTLSDTSTTSHLYWIRGISINSILVFDPISRTNLLTCPTNSFLATNTQPHACQTCAILGKVPTSTGIGCQCPPSTYLNPVNTFCVNCHYSCLTCVVGSPNVCLSCLVNRGLTTPAATATCVCNSGFTEINRVCVACTSGCATCSITASTCVTCISGRTLSGSNCVCPSGSYDNGVLPQCQPCPANCQNCQLTNGVVACTSCAASTTRSITVINNNCPCLIGFIQNNPITTACQACYYTCATCNGPTVNNCLTCLPGTNRTLFPSSIINGGYICQCNYGYADLGSSTCMLTSCTFTTGCINCVNNVCTQCDPALFRTLNATTYTCNCIAGYYQDTTTTPSKCVPCAIGCSNCTSATTCINCYALAILSASGLCSCQSGFFPNTVSQLCVPCPSICLTCTSATNCLTCISGFSQANGVCVCNPGTYLPSTTAIGCVSCPVNSLTCNSQGNPTSCVTTYYLYNNNCIASCPAGTYVSGTTCVLCPTTCSVCTGPTTCSACVSPNVLYNGICGPSCPSTTFVSASACVNCNPSCLTCNGATASSCLSCPTSPTQTYLLGNTCVANCPSTTTVINKICILCDQNCLTCLGTSTTCTSCQISLYLYVNNQTCVSSCPLGTFKFNDKCSDNCPSGYYTNGGSCSKCSQVCVTCSAATVCTSCPTPYYLFNGNCITTCPTGTILVTATSTCQTCAATCATCTTPTSCTTCVTGLQLTTANTCIPLCTGSTYFDGLVCKSCSTGCLSCTSPTACNNCANPVAILQGGQCLTCIAPCATCSSTSATECTSCLTGFGLSGNNCLVTCPNGQSIISGVCSCVSGFIYNGKCVASCPSGTTQIGTQCQICSTNCVTCSGNINACTSCQTGYNLVGGNCFITSNCPYGQAPSELSNCVNICSSNLLYLNGFCVQNCTSGYIPNSMNNACIASSTSISFCPSGQFLNILTSQYQFCDNCIDNCLQCKDSKTCTVCKSDYILFNRICIPSFKQCARNQFNLGGECFSKCPPGTNQQGRYCSLLCPSNHYYIDDSNMCSPNGCPEGNYTKCNYACTR